jgi:Na+/H+ antiporter NhaD/arsenite permease-like protein
MQRRSTCVDHTEAPAMGKFETNLACGFVQIGGITFFLSSVLDNLTSTIVMVSLLRKLVPDLERRKYVSS